jgi:hypothetical protein
MQGDLRSTLGALSCLVAASAVTLGACSALQGGNKGGGSSGGSGSSSSSSGSGGQCAALNPTDGPDGGGVLLSVSADVTAACGGTITAADGAQLVIPPGSLPQDATITLTIPADQTGSSGSFWYEISPAMNLNTPAKLNVPAPPVATVSQVPIQIYNASVSNPMLDDGFEQSQWMDGTVATTTNTVLGVQLTHFTGIGVLVWKDDLAYLVVDVPDQYMNTGDILITLSGQHPIGGSGTPSWFPGHAGLFTGSAGSNIIESVKAGVSTGTAAAFRTGFAKDHLYLGPRTLCAPNTLSDLDRTNIRTFAQQQLGKGYNLTGDSSHYLATLLSFATANLVPVLKWGGFTCSGLVDAAYDSVGKSPISFLDKHIINETPRDMYHSTCPVTDIRVNCGDHVHIPIYGVVVDPSSKVIDGAQRTFRGFYNRLLSAVAPGATSTYSIQFGVLPLNGTFTQNAGADGYAFDWTADPLGASVVSTVISMQYVAQGTSVYGTGAVTMDQNSITQALIITVKGGSGQPCQNDPDCCAPLICDPARGQCTQCQPSGSTCQLGPPCCAGLKCYTPTGGVYPQCLP